MIYTAKGAKETCRPPADCIILSIGSVKVTKTIQGITIDSTSVSLSRGSFTNYVYSNGGRGVHEISSLLKRFGRFH